MNEFPAVRVLLAAACLGAAGLAMPAHAALLNCEGLKLAAAKGVPALTLHDYKFAGSCQLVAFGGMNQSSSETLIVDGVATWNATTGTLKERLRVEGSLGKHSGDVETVFKCGGDPLIGAAACVVVSHNNSTKLDEFSGPPLKQHQPILKGRTTMAEATQFSKPPLEGAAAALTETSKLGQKSPAGGGANDASSAGAKTGAGAYDASSAGAKAGASAGAGTPTVGGTAMRVAPAMQPSAGSVAPPATTPQRGALSTPSAHAAPSGAAGGQRAQATLAGGSSSVVPAAAAGGAARELAALSCTAAPGEGRFTCATRAGFDRCEAMRRERKVERCTLEARR
jgi:hypothetical protein